jgi:hypothetical protein
LRAAQLELGRELRVQLNHPIRAARNELERRLDRLAEAAHREVNRLPQNRNSDEVVHKAPAGRLG